MHQLFSTSTWTLWQGVHFYGAVPQNFLYKLSVVCAIEYLYTPSRWQIRLQPIVQQHQSAFCPGKLRPTVTTEEVCHSQIRLMIFWNCKIDYCTIQKNLEGWGLSWDLNFPPNNCEWIMKVQLRFTYICFVANPFICCVFQLRNTNPAFPAGHNLCLLCTICQQAISISWACVIPILSGIESCVNAAY